MKYRKNKLFWQFLMNFSAFVYEDIRMRDKFTRKVR